MAEADDVVPVPVPVLVATVPFGVVWLTPLKYHQPISIEPPLGSTNRMAPRVGLVEGVGAYWRVTGLEAGVASDRRRGRSREAASTRRLMPVSIPVSM
ncbi:MAG TPA: hypothetical protein VK845_11265 [Gemmatimonadales bacterium]|nr:hypothetical protein [Gemmatimonadales bacterium]